MAIDLQNRENIQTGWPGPPQFHAPEIGSLVGAILRNKLGQQELTQKSIADAIKQYQEQRQGSAFGAALQNAGIVPQGVDVSGMSSHDLALLAQQIQAQTPDTERDALLRAQADYYNRGAGRGSSGGVNQEREARIRTNEEFKRQQAQAKILGTQAEEIASEQEDYGLKPDVKPAAHGYMMRDGKMDYARTPEEQANPNLVSPSDPFTDPNAPTFTPDVYKQREAQSALRQKILGQQKDVQAKMLTPPTADAGAAGGGAPGGQYPVGTRARRGDTWYVKQDDGSWQAEGQPNG